MCVVQQPIFIRYLVGLQHNLRGDMFSLGERGWQIGILIRDHATVGSDSGGVGAEANRLSAGKTIFD